ncbi:MULTISPECIES: hypothetical protein [Citricoccus]|uniref:Uncharacterized protein n=1 Tax=Citricoccus muralis TaxID=169134 RepID=A0ABY8H8H0_9MICC|nr:MULTISPECIES: hypothetical protein [Citricoccus]WBL19507.1 hypothetical protein O1A05_02015 [Citricoccus sp. NR2]WFP16907.1 hypothetical protein P8192_01925 [Citricoccus muralis]
MGMIPWFAWIAIVAIIVWGITMVVGTLTGRDLPGSGSSEELEKLKKRVKKLESQVGSGAIEAGAGGDDNVRAELEARLERLEIRAQKRDDQAQKHDDWLRRAEELSAETKKQDPDVR